METRFQRAGSIQAHSSLGAQTPAATNTSQPPMPDSNARRAAPIRMLRLGQVMELTGLRKTTIYELQAAGRFPMRVKITSHSVAWLEDDVQNWLSSRVAENAPLRLK
jgi:prophage regulatory protein